MLGRDVIYLIKENTPGIDEYGDYTVTTTERKVYPRDKKDISQREFYQAQNTDLQPEIKFKILLNEYKNEEYFRYKNVRYKIIRTYSPDDEFIELTGSAIQHDG